MTAEHQIPEIEVPFQDPLIMPTEEIEHAALIQAMHDAAPTRDGVFHLSAHAITESLSDAKKGATQRALGLLGVASRLPHTQVRPSDFLKVAKHAASRGNIKEALTGVQESISFAERNDEADSKHLSLEDIAYTRLHRSLHALQALGVVYSAFLGHKISVGKDAIFDSEDDFKDALYAKVSELEQEGKLGPLPFMYELPGKGRGEIRALTSYVLEIMGAIGESDIAERIHASLGSKIPGLKKSNTNKKEDV